MTSLVRISALVAAMAAAPMALAQTTVTTTVTKETTGPYRLTPEQRTTVYRTVTRERQLAPSTIVRPAPTVRYEIGAPVPRGSAELSAFPEDVYVDVPVLKRYRYVYVNNQLVLVDPETSQVVDIINE
jgi:Ni/Co efflux regulator RcnB